MQLIHVAVPRENMWFLLGSSARIAGDGHARFLRRAAALFVQLRDRSSSHYAVVTIHARLEKVDLSPDKVRFEMIFNDEDRQLAGSAGRKALKHRANAGVYDISSAANCSTRPMSPAPQRGCWRAESWRSQRLASSAPAVPATRHFPRVLQRALPKA